MAGLVPAIHALDARATSRSVARMRGGWVYIMTNRLTVRSILASPLTSLVAPMSIAKVYARDEGAGQCWTTKAEAAGNSPRHEKLKPPIGADCGPRLHLDRILCGNSGRCAALAGFL